MQEPVRSDPGVRPLGAIGAVAVSLAETSTPWDLEIDTLILSVASDGVGRLGESFLDAFPSSPLSSIDLSAVVPTSPLVVPLTYGSTPPHLTRLVLASVREASGRAGYRATGLDTVATAAVRAIQAAVNADGRRIGLPLLGAGVVGLRAESVAGALADAVLALLSAGTVKDLQSLVLFDVTPGTVDIIDTSWRDAFAQRTSSPTAAVLGGGVLSADPEAVAAPIADIPLSGTARRAVEGATGLADAGKVPISPALLFYAALLTAPSSGRRDVAVALLDALATATGESPSRVLDRLAQVSGVAGVTVTTAPLTIDAAAVPTVRAAVPLAARVNSTQVRQRHLLAAAMLDPDGASAIGEATGWTGEEARRQLRSAIASVLPQEFPEVWDAILLPREQPGTSDSGPARDLGSALTEDAVPADARIPMSEDSLDLKTYVTMLASAIAREDTPLPLSIGLFGEWGSGKSYFMGLLRNQIEVFEKSDNGAYLTGIEQITFNAWHYTDANLWASLASTIFERLGRRTGSVTDTRRGLAHRIEDDQAEADRVDAEARDARTKATALQAELRRRQEELVGSGATLLAAVQRSETVRAAAQQAWRALGIESPAQQQQLLADDARGLHTDLFALRRAARGRRIAVLIAVLAVAIVLAGTAVFTPAGVRQWLAGGGVVAALGVVATATGWVRRARGAVEQILTAVTETQDAARELAKEKLGPLPTQVDDAQRRAAVLAKEYDHLMARIGQAKLQLAELDPSRRWYDFVAERAVSPDYQGQLGLISIIRRDFEQLISLMKDWRKNPAGDDPEHRPINRIVLYIDDLDRCSPRQVMDVLQAVHLILAVDLFVVVVGVDPRWLLQSLRRQYRDNFAGDGPEFPPTDGEGWAAEPLDYLEKIFNIPFVLPRMTADNFKTFVDKISSDSDRRAADASVVPVVDPGLPESGSDAPTSNGGAASFRSGRTGSDTPPGEPDSDSLLTAGPTARSATPARGRPAPGLGLTPPELTLLAALGPVVGSPREAKRLLNIYRTLRAVGSATDFLQRPDGGGEYQALGILLGVLSAQPALLGRLLWAPPTGDRPGGLTRRSPVGTWAGAVEGLRPKAEGRLWSNHLGPLSAAEAQDWTDLLHRLSAATALVTLTDLAPFQLWGPSVARFSFILSPLAAAVDPTAQSVPIPGPALG